MSKFRSTDLQGLLSQTPSLHKIFTAIVFVGTAFSLYSWLYIIREVYIIESFGLAYQPPILSSKVRFIWDFFFAALSILIANNAAILYFLKGRRRPFTKRSFLMKKIKQDQIFVSGNFLFWFVKVGAMIGVAATSMLYFGTIGDFTFVLVLLGLVLFLESWKTLSRLLQRRKKLFVLAHFGITVLLALGLSSFKLIDHDHMDSMLQDLNPYVELSTVSYEEGQADRYDRVISLKIDWEQGEDYQFVGRGANRFEKNELVPKLLGERSSRREELIPFLQVQFWVPKDFPYKLLEEIQYEVRALDFYSINYVISPRDRPNDPYTEFIINRKLPYLDLTKKDSIAFWELYKDNPNYIMSQWSNLPPPPPVSINDMDSLFMRSYVQKLEKAYVVGRETFDLKELKETISQDILDKSYIVFLWDESTTFDDFIQFYAEYKSVVWQLRKETSPVPFDHLKERYNTTDKERQAINDSRIRIPMRFKTERSSGE